MICGLHPRSIAFNGNCWLCRKSELELMRELEVELFGKKSLLESREYTVVCRVRRLSLKKFPTKPEYLPIEAIGGGYSTEELMPFDEIGRRLGITKQAAQKMCVKGLQKLRKHHPMACRQLLALSDLRHSCLPRPEAQQ